MRIRSLNAGLLLACLVSPSTAWAQRFPFERTLAVTRPMTLDVSTVRGKVEVVAGSAPAIVVAGDVAVRVGWNVPADAIDLARQVAASPPITGTDDTVTLTIPDDERARRAVIVRYRVEVPPATNVVITTDSGETRVRDLSGSVSVRTQSSTIVLQGLTGATRAATGSGAVSATDIKGELNVTTGSSGFTGTGLAGALRVRTQSGEVVAALTGTGDVDVETGSSAIRLRGVRGGFKARSESGRITAEGAPTRPWFVNTGSSSVHLDLAPGTGFVLDASSRSSDVHIEGVEDQVTASKHAVRGSINGGGAPLTILTRSGSIHIGTARRMD